MALNAHVLDGGVRVGGGGMAAYGVTERVFRLSKKFRCQLPPSVSCAGDSVQSIPPRVVLTWDR